MPLSEKPAFGLLKRLLSYFCRLGYHLNYFCCQTKNAFIRFTPTFAKTNILAANCFPKNVLLNSNPPALFENSSPLISPAKLCFVHRFNSG